MYVLAMEGGSSRI